MPRRHARRHRLVSPTSGFRKGISKMNQNQGHWFGRNPLAGIDAFAPAFWRLIAQEGAPSLRGYAPPDVSGPSFPDLPEPAPLTNEGLRELRDQIPKSRGDHLQDIPPVPLPENAPYPSFTSPRAPLTSDSLRRFRDGTDGAEYLRDIPSPKEEFLRPLPNAEYSKQLAQSIKYIGTLRNKIERREAALSKDRGSQAHGLSEELTQLRSQLVEAEADLARQTEASHVGQKFDYGRT